MSTEAAVHTKATKPSGKDLKDAIKRQVEFYFSRANLANDAFLVSQMNSQMYVPVETIVGFGKIKQLTSNPALVVESIQDSKVVVLNDAKDAIKPNIKSERNTIILREIPSATKPEDVQALFADCGDVTVRSDVGDTWFVTLASEEDAVKTLLELRNKTFNDAPIKARLKSENVLKSFFPAPVEPVVAAGGAYSRGYYAAAGAANGYYDMASNYGPQYASGPRSGQYSNGTAGPRQGGRGAGSQQPARQNGGRSANATANGVQQTKDGRVKSGSFDQQQPRPASRKAKDKKTKAAAAAAATEKPAATGAKKGGAAASAAAPTERQPVLNSANFPPLPVSDKPAGSPYGEIKFSYAHEDILEIVKHMDDDDCKLPAGKMDFEAHAVALTPVAHPDLLRNQRTYSIEQAREALRQGRPIRSDSIGSIDYESMMYGEDYTKEARELRKQKAETAAADSKTAAAPETAAGASVPAAAAQPKVVGYAAALIYGTPAPQPPVEAKKKAPSAAATAAGAAAPATGAAAAGAKGKTAKPTKGDEKKAPKKVGGKEQAAVDETLPKAGAWGGRAFAEVVKAEPVNPPPAPAKAPVAAGTASPSTATKATPERKNSDGKWERNQKDRRPVGGDKQ